MGDIRSASQASARPSAWVLAVAAALLLSLALPAFLKPQEFLRDDSYFYLQIAANIVQGNGSTFHGITPTNGYHPLWMQGAVAAVYLAGEDRLAALHWVVALQALLSIGVAALFLRLTHSMQLRYGLVGVAVLLAYLFGTGVFASEAHLNALMLVAGTLALWRALHDDRAAPWFWTGVIFGLAILARLDNLFVVAALCGLGVLHDRAGGWRRVLRRMAAVALGGLLVLLPYLAHNMISYGHLMPISGAIKSTFPLFDFDVGRLGPVGKLAMAAGLAALAVGLLLDREPRRRLIWLGLGAGVLLHGLYVAGFTDHYTFWPWYYVSGVLAAALFAAWLPARLLDALRLARPVRARMGAVVYLLTFAVLVAGAGRAWIKGFGPLHVQAGPIDVEVRVNDYHWPEEFAVWMKTNLPAGSRVFVLDWPGAFAWYSELPILPMDGLVNDFKYSDELLALGAQRYLCAQGIQYYLGLRETDEPVELIDVSAPLYRRSAGVLSLHEDDLVVQVLDVVRSPGEALPFAMWRLPCAAGGAAPEGAQTFSSRR